jgi:5-hydroxyisourate hydrolase
MARSPITTHVLDTARGRPAAGVGVELVIAEGDGWRFLAAGRTDADGRVSDLLAADFPLLPGVYRLVFAVGAYEAFQGGDGFYPHVPVVFRVADPGQHHHVPLLLSPFGYSTYRGS